MPLPIKNKSIILHRKTAETPYYAARSLSWLERMIHNHEVPGSIPGRATKNSRQAFASREFICL